jgi:hypothetical protein
MDFPPPSHTVEPIVEPGVTCLACGYDLRGLSLVGVCPECGTPVSFSVRGDYYRFTDPDRLGRMALGATVIAASLLLATPLWFLLHIADRMFHSVAKTGTISAIGSALWVVAHGLGWWMLTEREPAAAKVAPFRELGASHVERARAWVRDAVLLFVVTAVGADVINMWRTSAWGTGAFMPGRRLAAALWLAAMVAGVGVLLTGMRHVMAMARRMPPGPLGTRAEFLFLLVATIAGMMALSAALGGLFYGLGMHQAVGLLSGTCGCMSAPLWLVALAGVMIATHNAATALRRERMIALELRRERERAPLL